MKLLVNTIPGYQVYEYQLVLNPHEELRNKILNVKQEFHNKFIATSAGEGIWKSKPQITLVSFVQYEMMEERLVHRLKQVAMGYHPIKIELKDYGSFPSHTIYINITSKLPVQDLVKNIRSEAQRLMKLNEDHKPHFIMEPHLDISRKLQPVQYEKGWLEYSHKHFTGRFIADAMLLLRRPVAAYKYQIVQRLEFQNLLVTTRQGELFS